jgi:predicted permease
MRLRRGRSDEDFDEEIRSHISHEVDRLVARGLPRAEAEAEAMRAFGSVSAARASFRGTQPPAGWEQLSKDVALALRALRREPWFAMAAVLTLALGIGLNTAIFSVLYGLVLRPLPLPEADRLVTVDQLFDGLPVGSGFGDATFSGVGGRPRHVNGSTVMVSYPEYRAYRRSSGSLGGLAAFATMGLTLDGETPSPVAALLVTCDYFDVLRAGIATGRALIPDDCASPGTSPVVVLGHQLWRQRFSGDASVVGRTIILNRTAFTVVGVAARGFGGTQLNAPDLYLPLTMQPAFAPDRLTDEDRSWLRLVGRLSPDAGIKAAQAELTAVGHRRDASYEERVSTVRVNRAALVSGPEAEQQQLLGGLIAFGVAGLIVLIACLNLMNLLLARAPARQRVVRIQLALGASRSRIVKQLLVESAVLAALGGTLGVALAYWGLPLPLAATEFAGQRSQLNVTPDVRVLGYAALVSLAAAIVFGLTPALEATRIDLATALRSDSPAGGRGTPRAGRLRHGIVAAQVAGSLLLLVTAALFARGIGYAHSVDLGYTVENVIGFRPHLESQGYDAARAAAYYRELRSRVGALPQVEAVGISPFLPLGARSASQFSRDGARNEGLVEFMPVSRGIFDVLEIPIERGSAFAEDEPQGTGPVPAVLSRAMADRFWPDTDPLGRTFHVGNRTYAVEGIAQDTRYHSALQEDDRPFFYAAVRLDPPPRDAGDTLAAGPPGLMLVVRTTGDVSAVPAILRTAREIDPGVLVTPESLEERFGDVVRPTRLAALFASLLGALAMVLAIVGVYGAVAYAASRRRHEIGVRYALGAARRDIVALVLRQGALPLAAGVMLGVLLAAAAARIIRRMIFGISPLDPLAYLGAAILLVSIALVAMLIPARRASSVDLARTLRSE